MSPQCAAGDTCFPFLDGIAPPSAAGGDAIAIVSTHAGAADRSRDQRGIRHKDAGRSVVDVPFCMMIGAADRLLDV